MLLYNEGGTKAQEDEAEGILQVLTDCYPGYPWAVRVYDGGFFIKNLMFDGNYGMNCKFDRVRHDWTSMKREIILMAGEWLERANLRRGLARDGEPMGRLEGVPEHRQMHRPLDDWAIKLADGVNPEQPQLRDTPRPQAIREMKASDG